MGEISLTKLVEMVNGPALHQPVIDPKCGIWNLTARTATLLDDVLPMVPSTEEMSAILHDSRDCTHTTLVLVSNGLCAGSCDREVCVWAVNSRVVGELLRGAQDCVG